MRGRSLNAVLPPLLGADATWEDIARMRGIEVAQVLMPIGIDAEDALVCFWACELRDGSPAPSLLKAIERARVESRAGMLTWRPVALEFSDHDRAALGRYLAAPGLILFAASRIVARVRPQGQAREREFRRRRPREGSGWTPDAIDQPTVFQR